jgi:hypothetical protein
MHFVFHVQLSSPTKSVETLHKQGACWYLDFCAKGIRSRKSLHTTQRDQAIVLARQIVADHASQNWGVLIPRDVGYADFFEEYKEGLRSGTVKGFRRISFPPRSGLVQSAFAAAEA